MSNMPVITPIASEIDKIRHAADPDERLLDGDDRKELATDDDHPPAAPARPSDEKAAG